MRTAIVILVVALPILFVSCVDNEVSMFIEHVKSQPEAPGCTVSVSDDRAVAGHLDVIFGNGFDTFYLLQNQLMSREDYDNLKAETNGIFIDSYEVSISTADTNEQVGVSERLPSPIYIEPESSELVNAIILPGSIVQEIADGARCLPVNSRNYPADSIFEDLNGNSVPRSLGMVNTSVQFFGHSQGGKDLETQRFTFSVYLCCGCLVNWYLCTSECDRYCTEPKNFEDSKMCSEGVQNGNGLYDCRRIYHNLGATWDCMIENEDREEGDTEILVPSVCNCVTSCAG